MILKSKIEKRPLSGAKIENRKAIPKDPNLY